MMDFAKDKNRTIIDRVPMSMPRAVVVAAAVGTAFGLGVVSARAAGPTPEPQAVVEVAERGDVLAQADARTKAYEAVVKEATSTWHAELTGPETAVGAVLPKKSAAVAAPEEPSSSSPTVDADVVKAPEPVVEAKPVVAETQPAARDKNEDRDDEEGDVDTAGAKPEKLAAAINKVLGEQKKDATTTDNRRYAVQLASTPKKDSAAREAADFVARGVPAKVVAAEVPGKGTMYRVRVSGLATRAAADAMKARIGQGLVVTDD